MVDLTVYKTWNTVRHVVTGPTRQILYTSNVYGWLSKASSIIASTH